MNREEKLEKLRNKAKSDLPEIVEAFTKEVSGLKNALGQGVEFNNLDSLIAELSSLKEFSSSVEKLNKTIDSLKIPDFPSSVEVKGLDKLVKSVSAKEVRFKWLDEDKLKELTSAISEIKEAINQKALDFSQSPNDFIPVRRVKKVGNRYLFDDDAWQSNSGGARALNASEDSVEVEGVVGVKGADDARITPATENTLQSISSTLAQESTLQLLTDGQQQVGLRYDEGATYTYIGECVVGTAVGSQGWRIKRLTNADNTIVWADGTSDFTKVWDDRAGYAYS